MKRALVSLAATLTLVAAPAVAQDAAPARSMQFGVQGGLSAPMEDGVNMGFLVAGTLDVRPATLPIGLRFDLGYSRYGLDVAGLDGNSSIIHGMGSAVYTIPTEVTLRPYLLGGLGLYRSSASVEGFDGGSETDVGFHLGGGLNLPLGGLDSYVEARFTFGDAEFIPIVFGIRF